MQMTMSESDKRLLTFVVLFAFLFFFVRFLLIPGWESHEQAQDDLAEAEAAQTQMEDAIMLASANAADKNTAWGELQDANGNYYPLLDSSELDSLVTELEMNHDLTAVSLDLSGGTSVQSIEGYVASTRAGVVAKPVSDTSAELAAVVESDDGTGTDTSNSDIYTTANPILQNYLAQLPTTYAQGDYLRTATVRFRCRGTHTNFMQMLDEIDSDYPSVLLESFSASDRTYAYSDGEVGIETEFTVELAVILCDKEGVLE